MYSKDYYKRLQEWNATEKYRSELDFLTSLLTIERSMKVLDYGCGIGTAMKHISEKHPQSQIYGFDINIYSLRVMPDSHFRSDFWFEFDRVYLMHSIAHFDDPGNTLVKLRQHLKHDGHLVIITPNADWLWLKNGMKNIKSDQTVIQHFTQKSLTELLTKSGYKVVQQGQYGEILGQQCERIYVIAKKNA